MYVCMYVCVTYAILVPKRVKRLSTAVTTGTIDRDEGDEEEAEAEEEEEEEEEEEAEEEEEGEAGRGNATGPGCNSFHSLACNSQRHVAQRPWTVGQDAKVV